MVAGTLNARVRIFLVDEHSTVREGLKLMLDRESDFEVVGDASAGSDAIEFARGEPADVIVIGTSLPESAERRVMEQLQQLQPRAAIVALAPHTDKAYLHIMLRAGVRGYVLKQSPHSELLRAIRAAATGQAYVDTALTHHLAAPFTTERSRGRRGLSERETEVVRLAATGHANKAIAARLSLSVKTIELHKANAMQKLQLQSRAQLVRHAVHHGWLYDL